MAQIAGIYSLDDLLAVRNASAASFGLNTIAQTLQAQTDYANARVNEMLADFAFPVTTQSAVWGGGGNVSMDEMDEFGLPQAGHNAQGITASFPLRLFKQTLGWTEEYFQQATPAEVATKYLELQKGYYAQVTRQMKKALFGVGGNYSFVDRLDNGVTLAVKTLINADSSILPDSPAGATFDGASHDHLDGEADLGYDHIDALVADVTEHCNTKGVKIYISATDRAAFSALYKAAAGDRFVPLASPLLQYKAAAGDRFVPLASPLLQYNGSTATLTKLDNLDMENQLIGYWLPSGAEVWVKPWAIANYALCVATGMPEKVLGYRQRANPRLQGWRIAAQFSDHPLIAEYAKAEFGFGVFNRTMAAVCYFANATWAAPTIA